MSSHTAGTSISVGRSDITDIEVDAIAITSPRRFLTMHIVYAAWFSFVKWRKDVSRGTLVKLVARAHPYRLRHSRGCCGSFTGGVLYTLSWMLTPVTTGMSPFSHEPLR